MNNNATEEGARELDVECPACIGSGCQQQREDVLFTPKCRACFGSGKLKIIAEELEDAVWDEAYGMLELFGVPLHEEAYGYRYDTDSGWRVVTFYQAKQAN